MATLAPFLPIKYDNTIEEVFALYDMTQAQDDAAWAAIAHRWQETSGRFHAYAIAHEIASRIMRGE